MMAKVIAVDSRFRVARRLCKLGTSWPWNVAYVNKKKYLTAYTNGQVLLWDDTLPDARKIDIFNFEYVTEGSQPPERLSSVIPKTKGRRLKIPEDFYKFARAIKDDRSLLTIGPEGITVKEMYSAEELALHYTEGPVNAYEICFDPRVFMLLKPSCLRVRKDKGKPATVESSYNETIDGFETVLMMPNGGNND